MKYILAAIEYLWDRGIILGAVIAYVIVSAVLYVSVNTYKCREYSDWVPVGTSIYCVSIESGQMKYYPLEER